MNADDSTERGGTRALPPVLPCGPEMRTWPKDQGLAWEVPVRLIATSILACLFLVGVGQGAERERLFEFRGRIVHADGKPLRHAYPHVRLSGTTFPYNDETMAGNDGRFRFRTLRPASYVLTIDVPGQGEMRRTIVISPSLADSRGRIEETFEFESRVGSESEQAGSISLRQLRIPDRAQREYRRARDQIGRQDIAAARKSLLKAVEIAPFYAEVWNELGVISYQTREFAEAEEYFRKALEQEPGYYAPLVNLGGALLDLHREEEALPINQRAAAMAPDDALPHAQLGLNYFRLRRYEEAEAHLKRAKTLDPRHFSAPQLSLAEVYAAQDRFEEAVRELQEYARLHPDSPTARALRQAQEQEPAPGPK
jgi:Flp pilus assembly protein TadD